MKKLPIGIQTFSKIIEDNLLYVDKTEIIYELINSGDYFFLSRPRRFGKSLLITTLKEIFSGNKELFKGLYIYDKIEWNKYPVIHIDFSAISHSDEQVLQKSLSSFISRIADDYNVTLQNEFIGDKFQELIKKIHEKTNSKIVILIDEYDKAIVDHITDLAKAEKNRNVLREFYSVIKYSDQYVKFCMITGVSKFARVSIFSGLNNLKDITLSPMFANILGIAQKELEKYFDENINSLMTEENITKKSLLAKIKHWYNGYSWNGVETLYNPFSLLNLFSDNRFSNYWFATGTPTFLINLIKQKNYDIFNMENVKTGELTFESYDIDNLDIEPLLFQTGYLTIKKIEKNKRRYFLSYPNYEVKESLLSHLLSNFTNHSAARIQPIYQDMVEDLKNKNINKFMEQIQSLFAKIPYTLHVGKEAYYHSIFYMILVLMGADIDAEVLTDKGRIDGVLDLDDKIYIIEFKYGNSGSDMDKLLDTALKQITDKKYDERFKSQGKEIIHLAVGFIDKFVGYKDFYPDQETL